MNAYDFAVVLIGSCIGAYIYGLARDIKQKHSTPQPEVIKSKNVISINKKGKKKPLVNDDVKAFKAEHKDNFPSSEN